MEISAWLVGLQDLSSQALPRWAGLLPSGAVKQPGIQTDTPGRGYRFFPSLSCCGISSVMTMFLFLQNSYSGAMVVLRPTETCKSCKLILLCLDDCLRRPAAFSFSGSTTSEMELTRPTAFSFSGGTTLEYWNERPTAFSFSGTTTLVSTGTDVSSSQLHLRSLVVQL